MTELSNIDMLLMHYVAGKLSPIESLMAAAHISLNTRAQRRVQMFEECAGKMIHNQTPAPVSEECLKSLMQKIDDCKPCQDEKPEQHHHDVQDPLCIPPDIYALFTDHCTEAPTTWKKLSDGIDTFSLKICTPRKGCRKKLSLMRLQSDRKTPAHHHHGREITLVLAGGYSDEFGHYDVGDISILQGVDNHHAPVADKTGCLCLVLTDGPLRFQNPLHRVLNIFLKV